MKNVEVAFRSLRSSLSEAAPRIVVEGPSGTAVSRVVMEGQSATEAAPREIEGLEVIQ